MNGIHEVRGSIPLGSTNAMNNLGRQPLDALSSLAWTTCVRALAGSQPSQATCQDTYQPFLLWACPMLNSGKTASIVQCPRRDPSLILESLLACRVPQLRIEFPRLPRQPGG